MKTLHTDQGTFEIRRRWFGVVEVWEDRTAYRRQDLGDRWIRKRLFSAFTRKRCEEYIAAICRNRRSIRWGQRREIPEGRHLWDDAVQETP